MYFLCKKIELKLTRPIAHLFLFTVALIYAANYTIAKAVLDDGYIEPGTFIVLRIVFAVVLFFVFGSGVKGPSIARGDWKRIIPAGLFGAAANMLLFFYGLKYTTPIHAALIMTTTPILVLIIALLLGKEALTKAKLAGILTGMLGAVGVILSRSGGTLAPGGVSGDLMILLNAASYGIYLIIIKDLLKKYPPLTVLKWVFLFGLIFSLPFGWGGFSEIRPGTFTLEIWLAVGFVLLFTTFFTYYLNVSALSVIPASTVSAYIYLQPVLATLIAVLSGKDRLTPKEVIYFLMIFLGVFLVSKKR